MKNKIRKIATICLIGTLTFSGSAIVTQAAEIPIAGIDVLLDDFYQNTPSADIEMKELLTPVTYWYTDMAIAQVTDYVNIRSEASEESTIVGKLYNDSAATIISEEGDWYKIESGTVTGFVKAEFLVTGVEVEELAKTVGQRIATVTTTTLKVREEPSLDASVQTLVPLGEELIVKKELDGWIKVSIDSDVIGYVSTDYVEVRTEFKEAESIEEETARLTAEAAASQEATQTQESGGSTSQVSNNSTSNSSSTSSLRQKIVNYALQFKGNPYVWGGTSLTNGADCSGFTQSVFRDNGISISRTSRTQANGGTEVSIGNIQLGDLVFYDNNGTINHVAIYIGNGKVISASNPESGIRITNYNYRQPYKVVSYIN
jgi:cell wall-associated NlpC family hydrolase